MRRPLIGELLVQMGRIEPGQLQAALAYQRQWGGRLGRAIVRLGFLGEPAILDAVGRQLGVCSVEIGDRPVPPKILGLVPGRLAAARRLLPLELRMEGRRAVLVVALSDPSDLAALDEVAFATGLRVEPRLAAEEDLDQALERLLGIPPRHRGGFERRRDAIELPEDTSPLSAARRGRKDWDGDPTLN